MYEYKLFYKCLNSPKDIDEFGEEINALTWQPKGGIKIMYIGDKTYLLMEMQKEIQPETWDL